MYISTQIVVFSNNCTSKNFFLYHVYKLVGWEAWTGSGNLASRAGLDERV